MPSLVVNTPPLLVLMGNHLCSCFGMDARAQVERCPAKTHCDLAPTLPPSACGLARKVQMSKSLKKRVLQLAAPGTFKSHREVLSGDHTAEDSPKQQNARDASSPSTSLSALHRASEDLNTTVESTHDIRVSVPEATVQAVSGALSRALLAGELPAEGQDDPKKKNKKKKGQRKQETEG